MFVQVTRAGRRTRTGCVLRWTGGWRTSRPARWAGWGARAGSPRTGRSPRGRRRPRPRPAGVTRSSPPLSSSAARSPVSTASGCSSAMVWSPRSRLPCSPCTTRSRRRWTRTGSSTPRQDLHHARAVTAPPLPTTRPYGVSFVSEGDLVPGPTPSFAAAPARRARRIGRLDRRNSPTPSASAGRPGGALRPGVAGGIESIPNRARRSTCRPIVRAAVAGVPGTG
jgi:hypothetical protein